jgi:hypothetical protein
MIDALSIRKAQHDVSVIGLAPLTFYHPLIPYVFASKDGLIDMDQPNHVAKRHVWQNVFDVISRRGWAKSFYYATAHAYIIQCSTFVDDRDLSRSLPKAYLKAAMRHIRLSCRHDVVHECSFDVIFTSMHGCYIATLCA